jgi:hypothetical protein
MCWPGVVPRPESAAAASVPSAFPTELKLLSRAVADPTFARVIATIARMIGASCGMTPPAVIMLRSVLITGSLFDAGAVAPAVCASACALSSASALSAVVSVDPLSADAARVSSEAASAASWLDVLAASFLTGVVVMVIERGR